MSLSFLSGPKKPQASPVPLQAQAVGVAGSGGGGTGKGEGGGIDLVFVVDETGSMGSEIEAVKSKLLEIMTTISGLPLCQSLRYGLIGYRDHCDAWAVKVKVPLTADLKAMEQGVKSMGPSGGGDYPEAVTDGLYELLRMAWRPDAAKCAVLVADAPPHGVGGSGDDHPNGCPCGESWMEQCESMKECGIVLHTVGCRNLREPAVFQAMASATNGRYFHLTQATKLPRLITGVADHDLDKLRVRKHVLTAVQDHVAALLRIRNEEDRTAALLSELRLRKVEPRSVDTTLNGEYKLAPRDIQVADISEAVCNLRRLKAWNRLSEVFPAWGAVDAKEKGGLFDKAAGARKAAAGKSAPAPPGGLEAEPLSLVPLTAVDVQVRIKGGFACEVEVAQAYVNNTDALMDAVYRFPLDELAAVTGFVAEIDGKQIVAKCLAKEKAKQVYAAAVAAGQGAFLLEQKRHDMFQMTVGNLLPQQKVVIRVTYIQVLDRELDGAYRFMLPTTVAPRYVAPKPVTEASATSSGGSGGGSGGDAKALAVAKSSDYALSIRVDVEMKSDVVSVVSPSHTLQTTVSGRAAVATLAGEAAEMDRDLVLVVAEKWVAGQSVFMEKWTADELGEGYTETTTMDIDTKFEPNPIGGGAKAKSAPVPAPQPVLLPVAVQQPTIFGGETGGAAPPAPSVAAPAAAAEAVADLFCAKPAVAASRAPMPVPLVNLPHLIPLPFAYVPVIPQRRRRLPIPLPQPNVQPQPQSQTHPRPAPVKPDPAIHKNVGDVGAMFVFNPTFANGWAPMEGLNRSADAKRSGELDHPMDGEGVGGAAKSAGQSAPVPMAVSATATTAGGEYDVNLLRKGVNLVVLCDASASMAGVQTDMVNAALAYLTKRVGTLPADTNVQVYKFGHEFELMWHNGKGGPTARPAIAASAGTKPLVGLGQGKLTPDQQRKSDLLVTQVTSAAAPAGGSALVTDAVMGGTQLLRFLRRLPAEPAGGRSDCLVVVTDGDVTELDKCVGVLKKRPRTEVFTIGVGHTMNHHNLRELANATATGAAEFCLPGESVAAKLDRQLQRVYAGLTNVSLAWSRTVDRSNKVIAAPPTAPDRFPCITSGSHVLTFALLRDGEQGTLSLRGENRSGEKFEWFITADPQQLFEGGEVPRGGALPRLAARALIRHYDDVVKDKAQAENAIVPLATTFTLASKYTSFVAVDERSEADKQKALDAFHEKQKVTVAPHAAKREDSATAAADAKKPAAPKSLLSADKLGGARGGRGGSRGGGASRMKEKSDRSRSRGGDSSDGEEDEAGAEMLEAAAAPMRRSRAAPAPGGAAPSAPVSRFASLKKKSAARNALDDDFDEAPVAPSAAAAPEAMMFDAFGAMPAPPPAPSASRSPSSSSSSVSSSASFSFAAKPRSAAPAAAKLASPSGAMRGAPQMQQSLRPSVAPAASKSGGIGSGLMDLLGFSSAPSAPSAPSVAAVKPLGTVRCAKGHAMTSYQGRVPSGWPAGCTAFNCDVCGAANQPVSSAYWHCDACADYDSCARCVNTTPRLAHVRCDKGHACTPTQGRVPKSYPPNSRFNCDVCNKTDVSFETNAYHCDTCDTYDVCADCLWSGPSAAAVAAAAVPPLPAFWAELLSAAKIDCKQFDKPDATSLADRLIAAAVAFLQKHGVKFTPETCGGGAGAAAAKPWWPSAVGPLSADLRAQLQTALANEAASYALTAAFKA